jgi:tRNA (guanine6-N2)-methyltransferase
VNTHTLALEYLPGLKPFVAQELKQFSGLKVLDLQHDTGMIQVQGGVTKLFKLRRVTALYDYLSFAIPRPKALLGDAHFRRLIGHIQGIQRRFPTELISFRLDAAGKDSGVFLRLSKALHQATGLIPDDDGALLIRIRPGGEGWEVLLRLTPRPLSARSWRVCNMAGGLNATIATAMNDLSQPQPTDRYLNAMCGSGTLLIERAAQPVQSLTGVDMSSDALTCAHDNLQAAKLSHVTTLQADATHLPYADTSFDVITADLPWGDAVGSHETNAQLYPAFLKEMARVAAPAARAIILTHEVRLFERCLNAQRHWHLAETMRFFHGGHYPRAYRLDLL